MSKLLRFEYRRIFRMKSLYITFCLSLIILVLNAVLLKYIKEALAVFGAYSAISYARFALIQSSFSTLIGIFLTLYCCDDYTNGTLKNIYSRGYSRTKVFFAKYIASLTVCLSIALIYIILALIMGKMFGNAKEAFSADFIKVIVLQMLLVVAFHSVFFSISMMIGKVGVSVAMNLAGPALVISILSLILALLKVDFTIGNYWLDNILYDLSYGGVSTKLIIKSIVMSFSYIAVFLGFGYLINRKKEM